MARYAAVDIGSNSVRLLVAEVIPGSPWVTLAVDREVTRLGASVFESGSISDDAMSHVCSVLSRFAATYTTFDVAGVRAVATSAVRDASNQHEFIERASQAIGVAVEIISGPEEARLIHQGVQSRWPHPDSRILIIDVGGGSAEFIVGRNGEMEHGVSRPLGAVRLTEVFLKTDPPRPIELRQLDSFIHEKFAPVQRMLDGIRFDRVIATSATAAAIVSAANHIERADRDAADRHRAKLSQVRKLFRQVSTSDLSMRRRIPGVGPRRAEIIVGGVAVFLRVMEELNLDALYYSTAGVRDGIIVDLIARGVGRERTRLSKQQVQVVEQMCRKYGVNIKYSRHIAMLAAELFDSMQPLHRLPPVSGKLLHAAAYLHDIGHFVSDTGHHKHSSYLVANSDLPGFTAEERRLISMLCRYHRKSMPQNRHEAYAKLSPDHKKLVTLLIPLMRLAVALNTSQTQVVEEVSCNLTSNGAILQIKGDGDLGLEHWAAMRVAPLFSQIYDVSLTVETANASEAVVY